ncbi:Glycerophosphoryl diester phosphodiesterase family-domain-containing protein [Xylariaceae sp. FL0594]|nr:Glycerophosphoryl diester phosphodiesterase family-domain-containing protein [Xylariaceae sp. FL0594]
MRFDIYHNHSPEWAEHYVQYGLLKSRLKAVPTAPDGSRLQSLDGEPFEACIDLMRLLDSSISRFEAFFNHRLGAMNSRIRNYPDMGPTIPEFHPHPKETEVVLEERKRVLADLQKFAFFARVNQEAIDRLLARFQRLIPLLHKQPYDDLEQIASRWDKVRNSQISAITEAMDNLPDTTGTLDPGNSNIARSAVIKALWDYDGNADDAALHLKSAFEALDEDKPDRVPGLFAQLPTPPGNTPFHKFRVLFVFFILHRSWRNAAALLDCVISMPIPSLLSDERLDIWSALVHLLTGPPDTPSALHVFSRILESLGPLMAKKLLMMDSDEGPLLSFLTKFGLFQWCQTALEKTQEAGMVHGELPMLEFAFARDAANLTPLHYAIAYKRSSIMRYICSLLKEDAHKLHASSYQETLVTCLAMAVKLGQAGDVLELLGLRTNVNLKSCYDMTALHIASREGRSEIVSLLLGAGADLNSSLHPRKWTPIFEAAVRGHTDIVQHLIQSGADLSVTDYLGWTVKELAMYRGHFAIAELLHGAESKSPEVSEVLTFIQSLKEEEKEIRGSGQQGDVTVVVNLGSMQIGRPAPAVQLKHCPPEYRGPGESLLRLEVCAAGRTQEIRLPILHDATNEPLIFHFARDTDFHLGFKVCTSRTICGGVATLDSNKLLFGTQRQSLVREHTVSLVDSTTFDIAGSVVFTYVIVQPFPELQSPKYQLPKQKSGYKEVPLVGHRDTQVTRDLEPVIYHDFSLSESGTDIPIHDVTVDQYKYTSRVQTGQSAFEASEKGVEPSSPIPIRPRSRSLDRSPDAGVSQIRSRLQYTVDFQTKGMKPNTRGDYIQQPLTTLKELFDNVPDTVGFNIEIKYPRFHESVEVGVAPIALELNLFVDTILRLIHLHGRNRPIILSSFTPEVCILLSLKQKAYPVMFITNAGKLPMTDVEKRATSMQVAVQFAKLWNLSGIVFASELFLICPRLISYVKSRGLVCASYGLRNNNPEDAIAQVRAGLDFMIVDRVGLIAKALKRANK